MCPKTAEGHQVKLAGSAEGDSLGAMAAKVVEERGRRDQVHKEAEKAEVRGLDDSALNRAKGRSLRRRSCQYPARAPAER